MTLDFLWEVFREVAAGEAIAGGAAPCTFSDLLARVWAQRERVTQAGILPGAVVTLPGFAGCWRVAEWEWRESGVELTLGRVPPGSDRSRGRSCSRSISGAGR